MTCVAEAAVAVAIAVACNLLGSRYGNACSRLCLSVIASNHIAATATATQVTTLSWLWTTDSLTVGNRYIYFISFGHIISPSKQTLRSGI